MQIADANSMSDQMDDFETRIQVFINDVMAALDDIMQRGIDTD